MLSNIQLLADSSGAGTGATAPPSAGAFQIAGISMSPDGYFTGGLDTIGSLFMLVINLLLYVGIIVSIIFLLIAGIRYIASSGDKQATQSAKQTLTQTLIGLTLLLGARFMVAIIESFFKVKLPIP